MMKLVIIDDEYLVRLGLRTTIPWDELGVEIVGEATNGKDGLALIERLRPDLVLSDIKMPLMDGVELVKALQTAKYDLAVIILSGYKDFDFAKGALENGAVEYLLKPIDNQELALAMKRAIATLQANRDKEASARAFLAELPRITDRILEAFFLKGIEPSIDDWDKLTLAGIGFPKEGLILIGSPDNREDFPMEEAFQTSLTQGARSVKAAFPADRVGLYRLFSEAFVLILTQMDLRTAESLSLQGLSKYETHCADPFSIGLSEPYANQDLLHACETARRNVRQKLFVAMNTVTVSGESGKEIKPLVKKTMDYIAMHYQDNVTVKSVTEHLYVSESYLLHMFKDNVGKTFNECLTDYRLLIAKRLLKSGDYKVFEVALAVGYADTKYFSQIFKKRVGMSPTDYVSIKAGV